MKILFYVYPWAFQSPGGGEIMLLKTKESLEKNGVEVKLFNQWEDRISDFDVLHVFGSVKDCLGLMEAAKSQKARIVLSPIFWSTLQRAIHEYGSFDYKIKMVLRHIIKVVFPIVKSSRRKMLEVADVVAPNSASEARQVARLFAINKSKMKVVPLGVDERFSLATPNEFLSKYKINDFVLSVGRIEPRKNQLNLIKAVKETGLRLVIIGDPVTGYEDYYNKCKALAGSNVLFINRLQHEDSLLASAYAACSVFVLQGWFETPGLVALEAGLAGARLAVTNGGSTRDYFEDFVEYLNPASWCSIRKAIMNALKKEKSDELKKHILNNFLWEKVAEENIKLYKGLFI
ncbi:MAG: glycosyltransferase [Candidatus Omnitrophica bacterium]|nr:glycosyltransferase [Candidatus Omnitrophota bacterium]